MGVRSWLGEAFGPEFRQSFAPIVAERDNPYSLAQWYVETMNYGGLSYPLVRYGATPVSEIPNDFAGFAAAMAANPVVFGCMALRMRVFSEVRFDFRKSSDLH